MENNLVTTPDEGFSTDEKREIADVREVIQSTMLEFHNYDFPKYISNYKKYLWFAADRLASIEPWQSNVDYPLVASTVDTMFWNLFDFWYEFGLTEPKMKKFCSEAFDFRWSGRATFKECTKEALITGKAYARDYLIKETVTDKFFDKNIKTVIKTPSMHYISVFDVMYDRSTWLSASPYKIVRTFTTWENIRDKVLPLILAEYSADKQETAKKTFDLILKKYKDQFWSRFSMYDYNPVKSLAATTQFYNAKIMWGTASTVAWNFSIPYCENKAWLTAWFGTDWTIDNTKSNYFLNADQSSYELTEYITSEKKYIFINGNLIYTGIKKYAVGDIHEINYSMIPGTGNANGVADNLWGLQDINDSLWNSFIDNIKLTLGPMFAISGNLPIGKNGTLDFKRFKAIRTNGTGSIEKIQLGVTDFAPINFMQMVEGVSEKRSGTGNYITGGGGSIERVAWGIDMKFNQYKAKLAPISDSIDQMMGRIARNWVMMAFSLYTIDELAKFEIIITEKFIKDENGKEKFDTWLINQVDIRDVIDEKNVTFTYNSLDKLTKENSRTAITASLPAMLQYAMSEVNMSEIIKVLAWQDFDPELIIKKKDPAAQAMGKFQPGQGWGGWEEQGKWWYDKPYMKWSSQFMPNAPFNPQDSWAPPEQFSPDEAWDFPPQAGWPEQLTDEQLIQEISQVTS